MSLTHLTKYYFPNVEKGINNVESIANDYLESSFDCMKILCLQMFSLHEEYCWNWSQINYSDWMMHTDTNWFNSTPGYIDNVKVDEA